MNLLGVYDLDLTTGAAATNPEPEPPTYDEIGLIGAEEAFVYTWLYACGTCGALVTSDGRSVHTRWHRGLVTATTPTQRIGGDTP